MKQPTVIWFRLLFAHHAFEVREEGQIDDESCCGKVSFDSAELADEPARRLYEFNDAPACRACLAVAELEVPSVPEFSRN